MGFESIKSAETVATPSMSPSEAPRHTAPGHEHCAYYFDMEDFRRQFQSKIIGEQLSPLEIQISCPHGATLDGAVYSEDFVNELRRLSHRLLGRIGSGGYFGVEDPDIETLRELTK